LKALKFVKRLEHLTREMGFVPDNIPQTVRIGEDSIKHNPAYASYFFVLGVSAPLSDGGL
jgi:hypothetical protein